MSPAEFESLTATVLVAILLLAAVLGFVMRETRFCTVGAISDVVYLQDWGRARQWCMAIAVSMLGFTALALWGQLQVGDALYASRRLLWLSALAGGLLFGCGMVLASGCGARNLTRLGSGSLKALVVLLVMGVAAFATLKGITAVARVRWLDGVHLEFAGPALLPEWLAGHMAWPLTPLRGVLGLGLGALLLLLALDPRPGAERSRVVLLGGLLVGLCVTAAWWLGGHLALVAEHPETLEQVYAATYSGRIEAFSFVTPVAHTLDWLMFFSDRNKVLTWGIASVAGVVLGSFVHALWRRDFQWQGFADRGDLARHLLGGLMMGVGGVTAMGCTVGQGISAISMLSLGSFVALAGIVLGAVLMLRHLAETA
ncbi:YeeE/YedE family protein [Comamonas thiooxydans]|uniref:YeeE/YedE family protein n=1 Tax=Comamonas thiooxydans TaxID=363952 RepID=A0AA42Q2I1_9BURK|nr:YeeE/YedE family protein [Comamonas thiooxydans]MDH1335141.1 YeeE/YedE family protein [Comamonas thiooxydans]MDH1475661.1 YeeE/YedE family protein [Comamonas thiooxydans]MDH1740619.1 YeeE/YedE family protein [Comamonas thiooxydans]MDH1786905.1 YeeE/YedE family protein [Comamonas thiooxydans]